MLTNLRWEHLFNLHCSLLKPSEEFFETEQLEEGANLYQSEMLLLIPTNLKTVDWREDRFMDRHLLDWAQSTASTHYDRRGIVS